MFAASRPSAINMPLPPPYTPRGYSPSHHPCDSPEHATAPISPGQATGSPALSNSPALTPRGAPDNYSIGSVAPASAPWMSEARFPADMMVAAPTEAYVEAADSEHQAPPTRPAKIPVIITHSSATNETPKHGRNVHTDALAGIATYHPYTTVRAGFRHDVYATYHTFRVANIPFERMEHAEHDLQLVLDAVAESAAATSCSRRGPTHRPQALVIGDVRSSSRRNCVEFTVLTNEPHYFADRIFDVRVLMDRHGFFIATSGNETKVDDYTHSIRSMPQRNRHYHTDGLPCICLAVRVVDERH